MGKPLLRGAAARDRRLRVLLRLVQSQQGFTLAVAMGIGVIILLLVTTLITKAQQDQTIATSRSRTSNSLAVTEGGMARVLAELTKPNNTVLLTRNYDPINPKTGKTYFGPDGILNNGNEESTAINEWTNIPAGSCNSGATAPSINYSGAIGTNGQYTLKAYRYNPTNKTGTFLVEGKQETATSYLVVKTTIQTAIDNFPGIVSAEKIELLGRNISGSNGNVYYDPALSTNPSLTGSAAPGEPARPGYLNAIKSGSNDGFTTDNVSGKIIACKLNLNLPDSPQGTDLGDLKNTQTLSSTGSGITYYQTNQIELKNNNIVDFDTTNGPIYLYVNGPAQIIDNAKIRNIRTDGKPPKVGDLRIIMSATQPFKVQDAACVQTAFIYSDRDKLELAGKADGCPSSGNSNIDGVVWMKEILMTSGDLSFIVVPDDVSSLADILTNVNLPIKSKLTGVLSWQRAQL